MASWSGARRLCQCSTDEQRSGAEHVKVRGRGPRRKARESTPRLGRAWGRTQRPKQKVGFAWYTEQQWQRLKELADDVEALDDTYANWLQTAEEAVVTLRSNGIEAMKVAVDVEEAARWCAKHGRPFNSAGRAAFVTDLLQTRQ